MKVLKLFTCHLILEERIPTGTTAQNEVKLRIRTFFTHCYLLTINILTSGVQKKIYIPNQTCSFKLQIGLSMQDL